MNDEIKEILVLQNYVSRYKSDEKAIINHRLTTALMLDYLEVKNLLDERFIRCHTSFIVNKDKIKEIDKKNRIAYMINGEECLISTRGIKNLFS